MAEATHKPQLVKHAEPTTWVYAYTRTVDGNLDGIKKGHAFIIHGQQEHIALMSNASEAISMIALGLDLKLGDNIVINTLEFLSGILPWLMLKEKGVEIRKDEHKDWQISVEDILEAVGEKTKVVMTSHVSFVSGAKLDYIKLYSKLKATQALLLLDVTQSLGVIPVHMYEADFVVCSSYKWLLSVHGLGILGINPQRLQGWNPKSAGWWSVKEIFTPDRFDSFELLDDSRRFELGFPSYPTIFSLNFTAGLLLEVGVERIEQHILALGHYLIMNLQKLNYEVMTPIQPEKRAGNISFVCSNEIELTEHLLKNNVYVWGGDGRIRASEHLFNDTTDIDTFISLLPVNVMNTNK